MPRDAFRGKFIVGNLKDDLDSPKTTEDANAWVQGILPYKAQLQSLKEKEIVICPSSLLAITFRDLFKTHDLPIKVGLQTVGDRPVGPYTGNIAPEDLKHNEIEYSIVGHTEKMENGETPAQVIKQTEGLLDQEIVPILCFRELSELENYIKASEKIKQAALSGKMCVAWEDPGNISKGGDYKPIPTERIIEYAPKIREIAGQEVIFFYGASVSPASVEGIFKAGAKGVLAGKASKTPEEFANVIINA